MKRLVELHCPRIILPLEVDLLEISFVEAVEFDQEIETLKTYSSYYRGFGVAALNQHCVIPIETWSAEKESIIDLQTQWEEVGWLEGLSKFQRILQWNMTYPSTHYSLF